MTQRERERERERERAKNEKRTREVRGPRDSQNRERDGERLEGGKGGEREM